jgi:hypothetical protein
VPNPKIVNSGNIKQQAIPEAQLNSRSDQSATCTVHHLKLRHLHRPTPPQKPNPLTTQVIVTCVNTGANSLPWTTPALRQLPIQPPTPKKLPRHLNREHHADKGRSQQRNHQRLRLNKTSHHLFQRYDFR